MKQLTAHLILAISLHAIFLSASNVHADIVNINNADVATLRANLKGIGQAKAEAIVAYRTQHGSFKSIDELKEVKGIGDVLFEKNKADLALTDTEVSASANADPTKKSVVTPASKTVEQPATTDVAQSKTVTQAAKPVETVKAATDTKSNPKSN